MEDKELDAKYRELDKIDQYDKAVCVTVMRSHYLATFNLGRNALAIDSYERMTEKYDEFFAQE